MKKLKEIDVVKTASVSSVAALVGLVAVVIGGSIWTGMAVRNGQLLYTAVGFIGTIVAGLYYLTLFRLAIGRRFFQTAP